MLFGKYGGVEIEAIPGHYLAWLATRQLRNKFLRDAVRQELRRRERAKAGFRQACVDLDDRQVTVHFPLDDVELLASLIATGHHHLSAQVDPDTRQRLDMLVKTFQGVLEEAAERAQMAGVVGGS